MPLSHLHFFHPSIRIAPHLPEWLAAVRDDLRATAEWRDCEFHLRSYDDQCAFDVPTAVDHVNRHLGPVVVIRKVQAALLDRFRRNVQRRVSIYVLEPLNSGDLRRACETARVAFENGEPHLSTRELIAYLTIRKLERLGKWGGTALNKNFLWAEDIPNGGFPKVLCDTRKILEVADALFNAGLLTRKKSEGKWKYALGPKATVQPILESRGFAICPLMEKFFSKDNAFESAMLLDYKEDS